MKTATIAALALLVAGCGATTSQHRADGFAAAIADRAFVRPGEDYRPGPGQQPTGVILLSPADADKNAAICNAFIDHLSSIGALREDDAAIIATYWLVEEMPENPADCSQLLTAYDEVRALQIRAETGHSNAAGAMIVGFADDGSVFGLDLAGASPSIAGESVRRWLALAQAAPDARASIRSQNGLPPTANSLDPVSPPAGGLRRYLRLGCGVTEITGDLGIPVIRPLGRLLLCANRPS